MRPLISICIPTFNRAVSVEALFANLHAIKVRHGAAVEICVSNNHSTDHTDQVIDQWKNRLDLKLLVQQSNIGATQNSIEVTKLATGRWVQIIGDDDAIYPEGFAGLVELLQKASPETWVLVGLGGTVPRDKSSKHLNDGYYPSGIFRKKVLRTGLGLYGFVGMHVFPASWLNVYHGFTLGNVRGWPHLALFLHYLLGGGDVVVRNTPVVEQAAGPSVLFWKIDDWVRVSLGRIDLTSNLTTGAIRDTLFCNSIALREFYAIPNVKNMILWKALEWRDFDKSAVDEYFKRYPALGIFSALVLFHLLLLISVRWTSALFIRAMLQRMGFGGILSDYARRKASMANYDGISRGL